MHAITQSFARNVNEHRVDAEVVSTRYFNGLQSARRAAMSDKQAMLLTSCRYLALVFAIVLAIVEAVLNSSREHWQYAPLWIIDYIIVAYLQAGFWLTRRGNISPCSCRPTHCQAA
jgi:uncharacterized membrane protein